jgi:DNA-binding NtrC family response regulator
MNMPMILIVDDDPLVLLALRRDLSHCARVVMARSLGEAREQMQEEGLPDLYVVDQYLGPERGLDLLVEQRILRPDVPRVLLTGQADLAVALQAINAGQVTRFLVKPWSPDELREVAMDLLQPKLLELSRQSAASPQTLARAALEHRHPGISSIERDSDGAIVLLEE